MNIRQLQSGDEAAFEAFLLSHADSSMFLRANARRAGLDYRGEPYQAIYAAAFRGGRMLGVAAHCWNGMLLVQAPDATADVAAAAVEWSGRKVTGLAGPADQVRLARSRLKLDDAKAAVDADEKLYALALSELVIPAGLANGTIICRAPLPDERDALRAWRMAYDLEALAAADSPEQRQRSAAFLDAQIADGHAWVAVVAGAPVSLSAFNAVLPDMVQLGGIYTPPELRGRGFAKAAVAASLLAARRWGVSRAILFTGSASAARTYEALGFRRAGDYALVLLR
jgi:GNAT superfamily N-acetyltransferase